MLFFISKEGLKDSLLKASITNSCPVLGFLPTLSGVSLDWKEPNFAILTILFVKWLSKQVILLQQQ